MQQFKASHNARFELLAKLESSAMPAVITESDVIVELLAIHTAGLIEGDLPEMMWTGASRGWADPAMVYKLTRAGEQALVEWRRSKRLRR